MRNYYTDLFHDCLDETLLAAPLLPFRLLAFALLDGLGDLFGQLLKRRLCNC